MRVGLYIMLLRIKTLKLMHANTLNVIRVLITFPSKSQPFITKSKVIFNKNKIRRIK